MTILRISERVTGVSVVVQMARGQESDGLRRHGLGVVELW